MPDRQATALDHRPGDHLVVFRRNEQHMPAEQAAERQCAHIGWRVNTLAKTSHLAGSIRSLACNQVWSGYSAGDRSTSRSTWRKPVRCAAMYGPKLKPRTAITLEPGGASAFKTSRSAVARQAPALARCATASMQSNRHPANWPAGRSSPAAANQPSKDQTGLARHHPNQGTRGVDATSRIGRAGKRNGAIRCPSASPS
jgi:hypothetical protein